LLGNPKSPNAFFIGAKAETSFGITYGKSLRVFIMGNQQPTLFERFNDYPSGVNSETVPCLAAKDIV